MNININIIYIYTLYIMLFIDYLKSLNLSPDRYMNRIRLKCSVWDYNFNNVHFSDNEKYKLYYEYEGNKIYFGKNYKNDFEMYRYLCEQKKYTEEEILFKRQNARDVMAKSPYFYSKYSHCILSLRLLW